MNTTSLRRGVLKYVVSFLAYWYAHQAKQVKWSNSDSSLFVISNGVKKGGILSLVLFNVYSILMISPRN